MVTLIKLRLTFRALQDMNFPIFAGSALRGIFGKSLRRVSCLAKQESCDGCAVRQTCPYAFLFENGQQTSGKNNEIPNPYVIEPMKLENKQIKQNEEFSFNCLIFGKAVEKLSYIVLAWVKVGNLGFTTQRTQARLIKIEQINEDGVVNLLYDFEQTHALQAYADTNYSLPKSKEISKIRITLKTPLRIHHEGHPVVPAKFTAQDFLISLVHRQENMAKYFMPDYPVEDFNILKKYIDAVKLSEADLHWFDWSRYSSRQKKRIALGGIMGNFVLQGNMTVLYAYLKMGELFHLGKSCVLGMGKYTIEIIE